MPAVSLIGDRVLLYTNRFSVSMQYLGEACPNIEGDYFSSTPSIMHAGDSSFAEPLDRRNRSGCSRYLDISDGSDAGSISLSVFLN